MTMRSYLRVLLALCMAVFVSSACASKTELPAWVTQAAATQVQVPPGAHPKAAILLEDQLLTVSPTGQVIERYRRVVKILRPQGRDYAHPFVEFNKENKLLSFRVWSIGPDGHHYTMKKNQIVEGGANQWGILYDDARYKTADPPGADPGGVIAYEYTEQIPMYSGNEPWRFQHSIPTMQSFFEVDLPPGWQHRALWRKYTSVEPTEIAPNHFQWKLANIPGIDLDSVPLAPAEEALAGRMEVYFSPTPLPQDPQLWARIGAWYTQLAAPQSEGTADIANASLALIGTNTDFTDRIQKVAGFIQQQIRYVGIEIGVGGYIPHTAAEIYRNRYGDCKDKVTLLISMLKAVGVRATWVMVDTDRGVVDPAVPSLIGDHMIAAIEIPPGYQNQTLKAVVTAKTGKHYLLFDPTNPYVPIGLLPTYLQGGTGLLLAGPDSEAIALPVLSPDNDTVDRTGSFTLGTDGSLTGDITVKRLGASSDDLRRGLFLSGERDKQQSLENSLRSDFSSFQVSDEQIKNLDNLHEQLILQYHINVSSYAKNAGALLLVRPRVVGSDALHTADGPRLYPVELSTTGKWRDTFNIKIPAGYTVDDLPDPVNVDTPFASYSSAVTAKDGVLSYSREYTVKKVALDADQYPALRKFESEIYTDENRNAVLKKAN